MTREYSLTILRSPPPYSAQASFPKDFIAFDGHFPGNPILPGFMHIQLALDLLRQLNLPAYLREVTSAKFLRPIFPEEKLVITLTPDQNTFAVDIAANGQPCSHLVLITSPKPVEDPQ